MIKEMSSLNYSTPVLDRIIKSQNTTKDSIVCVDPLAIKEYDSLYENWSKPTHAVWKKFIIENDITHCQFLNQFKTFYQPNETQWVGYYLFKQRLDRRTPAVKLTNKTHNLRSNTLLLCRKNLQWKLVDESINSKMPELLTVYLEFGESTQKILDYI